MNNIIKFYLLRGLLLFCTGIGLLAVGCSNDNDDSSRELASKTNLTLTEYYNEQGTITVPAWERNNRAGLFVTDQNAPEAVYKAPIQSGSQKSLFLFTLDAPQHATSTVVAFWPSDANLRCENGTLKTVIPTMQTGFVTPILVGKATAQLNAYEGCSMELKNLFCTMYISAKKGHYSVSKVVIKANGGEAIAGEFTVDIDDWSTSASEQTITVTLPTPMDCSQETQLIPVMIAPATLLQGYTVTIYDSKGEDIALIKKTEPVTLEAGGKLDTDLMAGPAFPSQWIFSASTVGQYNSSWSASNMLPSTSGSSGYISVVRGEANVGREFTRTVNSYRPSVSTMVEGDYWLYTLPVRRLEAGTAVEFDATMAGEANSPKYFIVEYLDGGVWKSVEEDLLTAPEDPSIRYSYKCSGVATGTNYQHASIMQTIRFTDPVEGAVQIRCRAVGPYTCTGGTQDISADDSASQLPQFGFSGSYVQNLGTAVPGDTKKVLCLGNSFSYYSNPAWMLKEIAWNEGHYLNVKGHFKGSQNFGQQLGLSFSTDAIDIGGYDYAFIQDQSQNPATYGRDGTASIAANCTALADKIRAKSASCKVILEQTWTFSASSYGGFTDFATFENYNAKGARAMAKAAGTWISPIGEAFRIVREGSSGINLYHTDNKHQSVYGAYLKACVNYLVLYGEAFGSSPADCGIEASKAAYLRSVAEQVVLGHENEYLIQR